MTTATAAKPQASPRARSRRKRLTLREFAAERGLRSLNALATAAGVSQPTCSQANRGMVPRPLLLDAIARALGATTDEVLAAIKVGHSAAKRAG